ncbi:hypothetical protein DERF_014812 [Dermatophagoides farinae]|uniref:DRBM domain-containing protein n=1 Tax=Dermatophagoides farinae TaxID=6954 RepID=A0A922L1M6_DERFA|nr:hypothetical protein DERF_014812 [Dermatophagoides farinae]
MDSSNPIGYLQNLCSKIGWLLPIYKEIKPSQQSTNKLMYSTQCILNDIVVIGESNTKKNSKKDAAIKMMKSLNENYRSTITICNLQTGIKEEKIRLLLSDIHSIKTIKMLYDMHSKGLAKAEVIVGDILDMLVAKKLYNGYSYQNRKLSVTCQAELIKTPEIDKQTKRKRKSKRNRLNRKFAMLDEEKPKKQHQMDIFLGTDDDDENENDKSSKKDVQDDNDTDDDNKFLVIDDFTHPKIVPDHKPIVPLDSEVNGYDIEKKSGSEFSYCDGDNKIVNIDNNNINFQSVSYHRDYKKLGFVESGEDRSRILLTHSIKNCSKFICASMINSDDEIINCEAIIDDNDNDQHPEIVPTDFSADDKQNDTKELTIDESIARYYQPVSDEEIKKLQVGCCNTYMDDLWEDFQKDLKTRQNMINGNDSVDDNDSAIINCEPMVDVSKSVPNQHDYKIPDHNDQSEEDRSRILLVNSIKNCSKFTCADMIDGDDLDNSDSFDYESIVDDDDDKNHRSEMVFCNGERNDKKKLIIDDSIAHYYQPISKEEMKKLQLGSCNTYIDGLWEDFQKTLEPKQKLATDTLCDGLFHK